MKSSSLGLRATRLSLLCALALLASSTVGCKKKSGGEAAEPVATVAADKCTDVAVKVGSALETEVRAGAPETAKEKLTPIFAEIQTIMKTRCAEDKWPDEFTDCVLAAADAEAIGACNLPPENEKALSDAMEALTPKIMEAMSAPAEAPAADAKP
ncbi:MAG: hypothetical protein IPL79_15150 [Myxococcales bacterium]|nr:hypothetical protein [Myxococcales bacterium]